MCMVAGVLELIAINFCDQLYHFSLPEEENLRSQQPANGTDPD